MKTSMDKETRLCSHCDAHCDDGCRTEPTKKKPSDWHDTDQNDKCLNGKNRYFRVAESIVQPTQRIKFVHTQIERIIFVAICMRFLCRFTSVSPFSHPIARAQPAVAAATTTNKITGKRMLNTTKQLMFFRYMFQFILLYFHFVVAVGRFPKDTRSLVLSFIASMGLHDELFKKPFYQRVYGEHV